MTVVDLTGRLTHEELTAWAAFYEIKAEEEERAWDRARTGRGARTMTTR